MMKGYEYYNNTKVTWIGKIPANWSITKVKFVCRNLDGKRIPVTSSERLTREGKYPYYGATGIIDYVDEYIFDGDYVLIGEDGAPFNIPNRDVAFIASGKFWVNNHAHIILALKIRPKILVYSLNIVDYSLFVAGSTREKLTQFDLSNIYIPDIPFAEQQKIFEFLDHKIALIDKFTTNRKKQIELLEEKKAAIINKAVTKGIEENVKLKPSGIEWIGEIPLHWEVWKLKFISRITTGGRNTEDRDEDGIYPFYVRADTVERINSFSFDGEAILTAGDGVGVGRVFHFVNGKFDFHQRVYKMSNFKRVLGKFLYFYMVDNFAKEVIKLSAKTTVDSLRLPMLSNFPVAHPAKPEQKVILEYIERESSQIENLITKYQKQIDLIQEYKTALISKAVTGKIDVRDWQQPINSMLNKTK